jgi:hypothetical protein
VSGPKVIGEYELLDRIAEGGMAEVWRARSRGAAGFEKIVVLKRVLPALAARPGFADLLIREAKIAARLSHPNIVQIFDLGEADGTYFIAMEYVHGTDLARALTHRASSEHLPPELRVWIAAEATRALDHAHRRRGDDGRPLQIVHRDVSPQNVLLAHEGVVKVADFGIARADEAGLGRGEDPKVLRGKYGYMSPEQARGEPLDRRSDVFALGVVLFEVLTGQRLFRGKSSHETLQLVRAAKIPDLRSAGVPDGLVPTLNRALAAQREQRHAWAGEIHQELMAFLYGRGQPVGERELAAAMEKMFPAEEHLTPNKLRVDVMLRAHDDATGVSVPGSFPETAPQTDSRTQSLPIARRARLERRRVALVSTRLHAASAPVWAEVVDANGGTLLAPAGGAARAVFGQLAGVERAPIHAVRAALDFQHRVRALGAPVEGASVVVGDCRVSDGVLLEPDPELDRLGADALEQAGREVTVPAALLPELERVFVVSPTGDGSASLNVNGYRRRQDRDLDAQRALGPLVARRAEMDVVRAAVEASARAPQVPIHLSGVPGSGKTRLLAELRATVVGVTWIVGRADEADSLRDHGIFRDLVRDLCGIEHDDTPEQKHARIERARVLGLAPHEVRTLGEAIGLAYPVPSMEREGRPRGIDLIVVLRRCVLALARDRPVVVVLEDLHFADDASLQLLRLLLHGLQHRNVLCVTSRRAGAIVPASHGRFVVLEPLDDATSGKALAAGLAGAGARAVVASVARWAREETGGVPECIGLLARFAKDVEMVEGELVRARVDASLEDATRQRVAAWLDPLRRTERHLLLLVALCPLPIASAVLVAAIDAEPQAAERALDRLIARGWVSDPSGMSTSGVTDERSVGRWGGGHHAPPARVAIASRMLARAVSSLVDEGERARAHQRLLALLEVRPSLEREDAELLAYHAARATDRQRAVEYHVRACDLAENAGALADAARLAFDGVEAARASGEDADGERLIELTSRAARLWLQAGHAARADEAVRMLADLIGTCGRPEQRVALARLVADVALEEGRGDRAADAMLGVATVIDAMEDPAARAEARIALVACTLRSGAPIDFAKTLSTAKLEAATAGDVLLEARALAVLASALARSDEIGEADGVVPQVLALAARLGHAEIRAASLAAMGALLEALGEPSSAAARLDEAAALAREASLGPLVRELAMRSCALKLRAGEDVAAAKTADALIEREPERRGLPWVSVGLAARAVVSARAHADPALVETLERARAALPRGAVLERLLVGEMRAHLLEALEDLVGAALARDDAAELADAAGWRSAARQLRGG